MAAINRCAAFRAGISSFARALGSLPRVKASGSDIVTFLNALPSQEAISLGLDKGRKVLDLGRCERRERDYRVYVLEKSLIAKAKKFYQEELEVIDLDNVISIP
jgi:hypothetical protein